MLVSVLVVPAIPLVILLANGGFVWREDCMTARGSVQTSHTYRINQVIPYLAPSEAGCSYYSGTRVAASAIGFWKIPDVKRARAESSTNASPETARFVAGAADVLAAVSTDWEGQKELRANVLGVDRSEAIAMVRRGFDKTEAAYEEQIDRLEGLSDPSDDELALLKTSLTGWLRIQLSANEITLTALDGGGGTEQINRELEGLADDLISARTSLLRLRAVLPSRYPELDSWTFLDND